MNADDAEEYTQSLGQIWAGSYRQVLWAEQQGIPAALGLTVQDWVNQRLGGYVRMAIPDRREAVKELTAPVEDGGNGLSTREAAAVLGVAQSTVVADRQPERNRSPEPPPPGEDDDGGERNRSPEPARFALSEPEEETPEQKAYYALSRQRLLTQLDPEAVAQTCADPSLSVDSFEALAAWLERFSQALRARIATPLRAVK